MTSRFFLTLYESKLGYLSPFWCLERSYEHLFIVLVSDNIESWRIEIACETHFLCTDDRGGGLALLDPCDEKPIRRNSPITSQSSWLLLLELCLHHLIPEKTPVAEGRFSCGRIAVHIHRRTFRRTRNHTLFLSSSSEFASSIKVSPKLYRDLEHYWKPFKQCTDVSCSLGRPSSKRIYWTKN